MSSTEVEYRFLKEWRAKENCNWVRAKVAERGLTEEIQAKAVVLVAVALLGASNAQ
jgi:hypothetical protein